MLDIKVFKKYLDAHPNININNWLADIDKLLLLLVQPYQKHRGNQHLFCVKSNMGHSFENKNKR